MPLEHFSKKWQFGTFPGINLWEEDKPANARFVNLAGSADAVLICDLFVSSERPMVVFVENGKRAEILAEECKSFIDGNKVILFPSRDAVPYNMKSPFGPTVEARYQVLAKLMHGERCLIIAPYTTLLQKIQTQRRLFNNIIRLVSGNDISIDDLSKWLSESGFRRENQVTDLGTYSIRGGIVDIYPFLTENPLRIEFWGDTIDTIREFDVFSQKSLERRQSVEIFPMREFCITTEQVTHAIEGMLEYCKYNECDASAVHRLEHQWIATADYDGIEWYLHWFGMSFASILDYLPTNALVVWDDLVPLTRRIDEAKQNYARHQDRVPELFRPLVSSPDKLLFDTNAIEESIACYEGVYIETLDTPRDTVRYEADFQEQPHFSQNLDSLIKDLTARYNDGMDCYILSPNQGHAERLQELLGNRCPFVEMAIGYLHQGFIDKINKLVIYTETQLFNRQPHRAIKVKKRKSGVPITGFDALSPNDFVVHEDHGIGRFLGVERISAADVQSDCMVIQYADRAKVYVPVEDFHKVQKYVGKESFAPTLSKLGTSSWERLKTRTRESLKEMANELVDLYAKRSFLEGIQFSKDTLWQKEFDDSFIFDETPDQVRAIKEVKEDMESAKPMDRLVCGDVGFGKTEVAMRAAFKAVMSGHQVAILAPTTILAAQHYATLTERMADFPVKIGMLSRFLKGREQRPVVEKVKSGGIDILVGTHRILSRDIEFKNLGLLVVDEEQRFGVRHKEKLKQYRFKVDVLSLSATPIPRTLHMSLVGARDLSVITTPPRNRLPIETRIAESHDEIIKSAIENELDRGGQVYFVSNRIKNLALFQDKIEQLVPRARVVIAHGQMDEKELELIMKEFVAGRFDVLLSTVIIENGLDIPNVNTIIINRADTLGLSQLYQLRGRVGRSSEQAYAYLLTPPFRQANEVALKRLRALEQYTELGSGFQIAMRDLEIRGAGNLLGTRQHGFIAAVGFEMYCRLLQDAIKEIQGEKPEEKPVEIKVELPLQTYIPTEYVADGATRIALYQELSSVTTMDMLDEFESGLADRFGPVPKPVHSLVLTIRTKILAQLTGCQRIVLNNEGNVNFTIFGSQEQMKERIGKIMTSGEYQFDISIDQQTVLKTKLAASTPMEQAQEIIAILERVLHNKTKTLKKAMECRG